MCRWIFRNIFFLVGSILFTLPLAATTYTLVNPSGGNWSDTTIWSPAGYPSAGDTALIDQPGAVVTVDLSNLILSNLWMGSPSATLRIQGNNVSPGTGTIYGHLEISQHGTFGLGSSQVLVYGTLSLDNASAYNVILHGTGVVTGDTSTLGNITIASGGTVTWTGGALKIYGTNRGTLYGNGALLLPYVAGLKLHNRGKIVKNGGPDTLRIPGSFFNDSASLFWVQSGVVRTEGAFTATACTLRVGTNALDQQPLPSWVLAESPSFQDVILEGNGDFVVPRGVASPTLMGTNILKTGTRWTGPMHVEGSASRVYVYGTVIGRGHYTGAGRIRIENGGAFRITSPSDTTRLYLSMDVFGQVVYSSGLLGFDPVHGNYQDTLYFFDPTGTFEVVDSAIIGHKIEGEGVLWILGQMDVQGPAPVVIEPEVIVGAQGTPGFFHTSVPLTLNRARAWNSEWEADTGALFRAKWLAISGSMGGTGLLRVIDNGFEVDTANVLFSYVGGSLVLQDSVQTTSAVRAPTTIANGVQFEKVTASNLQLFDTLRIQGRWIWRTGTITAGLYGNTSAPLVIDTTGWVTMTDTALKVFQGASALVNKGLVEWTDGAIRLETEWENQGVFRLLFSDTLLQGRLYSFSSDGQMVNQGNGVIQKEGAGSVKFQGIRLQGDGVIWGKQGELLFDPVFGRYTGEFQTDTTGSIRILSTTSGGDTLEDARITVTGDSTPGVFIGGGSSAATVFVSGHPMVHPGARMTLLPGGRIVAPDPTLDTLQIQGSFVWAGGTLESPTSLRGQATLISTQEKFLKGSLIGELWSTVDLQEGTLVLATDWARLIIRGTLLLHAKDVVLDGGQNGQGWLEVDGGTVHVASPSGKILLTDTMRVLIQVPVRTRGGHVRVSPTNTFLIFRDRGAFGSEQGALTSIESGNGVVVFDPIYTSYVDTFRGMWIQSGGHVEIRGKVWIDSTGSQTLYGLRNSGTLVLGPGGSLSGAPSYPLQPHVLNEGKFYWDAGALDAITWWNNADTVKVRGTTPILQGQANLVASGGVVEVLDTARLTLSRSNLWGRISLRGDLLLQDSAAIIVGEEDTLLLQGAHPTIQGDPNSSPSTIWNEGIIVNLSPDTSTVEKVNIEGTGDWQLNDGLLRIRPGVSTRRGRYEGGTFRFGGGTLEFDAGNHELWGGVRFQKVPVLLAKGAPGIRVEPQPDARFRGTMEVFGPVTVDTGVKIVVETGLQFMADTSSVVLQGTLSWVGGDLDRAGSLLPSVHVAPMGHLQIRLPAGPPTTLAAVLMNAGTVTWDSTSGPLFLNGAPIINDSTGQMFLRANTTLQAEASSPLSDPIFLNRGQMVFEVNGGLTVVPGGQWQGMALQNLGTVEVRNGQVTLYGQVLQSRGATRVWSNTSLSVPNDTFSLRGGRLEGEGSVLGTLLADSLSTVAPGFSPGHLSVGPTYHQGATATLEIELGGSNDYDQLLLGPTTVLGGTLRVLLSGTYTPTGGERFAILRYPQGASPQGDFGTTLFPDLAGGRELRPMITDTGYILRVLSPPHAGTDLVTIQEDQDTLLNLLANDSDPDSDSIYVSSVITTGTEGTVTLDSSGLVYYVPAPDSTGLDHFLYVLEDTTGMVDTADVSITILPVNDAPQVSFAPINWQLVFDEDQTATLDLDDYVEDPDNPDAELTWSWQINPSTAGEFRRDGVPWATSPQGSKDTNKDVRSFTGRQKALDVDPARVPGFSGMPDGLNISIDPVTHVATFWGSPNYNNPDGLSVRFTATDPEGASDFDFLTVRILPVADPPSAQDDGYTTEENTPLNVPSPGILGNDSDPDGDPLGALLVAGPTHGDLTLNLDGSFSYVPDPDYHGTDTFTYQATDGSLLSDPALVTLTITPVNDTPWISFDAISGTLIFDEDSSATLDLDNFSGDPDGEDSMLTYSFTILPDGGPRLEPSIKGEKVHTVIPDTRISAKARRQPGKNPHLQDPRLQDSLHISLDPVTHVALFWADSNYNNATGIRALFTVSDPQGASDADTLLVVVTPVNDPPTSATRILPVDGDTLSADSGVAWVWTRATDVDADPLWYLLHVIVPTSQDTVLDTLWVTQDTTWALPGDSLSLPAGTWPVTWTVFVTDTQDTVEATNGWGTFVLDVTVGIEEPAVFRPPPRFVLYAGTPNPFRRKVTLRYQVPEPSRVQVTVYDALGRVVRGFGASTVPAGEAQWTWNGTDRQGRQVQSGIYFLHFEAQSLEQRQIWSRTIRVLKVR